MVVHERYVFVGYLRVVRVCPKHYTKDVLYNACINSHTNTLSTLNNVIHLNKLIHDLQECKA